MFRGRHQGSGVPALFSSVCLIWLFYSVEEPALMPCPFLSHFLRVPFFLTSHSPSPAPLDHPIQPSMQDQEASQRHRLTFLLTLGESHSLSHFPNFTSD